MYYDYKYHAIIVSTVLRSHVNLKAGEDTRVCDKTSGKFLGDMIERDESLTCRVKNNHIYSVYFYISCLIILCVNYDSQITDS